MTDEFNGVTEVPVKKNVFSILDGGKTDTTPAPESTDGIPQNEYRIVDIEGAEYFHEGFLLFTSQHIAVMRDTEQGALPIFILPLNRLAFAELFEDDEVYDEEAL